MTLVRIEGKKLVKLQGQADNSGGTSAAQIDVTLTAGELKNITDIISVFADNDATVHAVSVTNNVLTVTVTVPAGVKSNVYAVVLGY